jgi:hypothetical protein
VKRAALAACLLLLLTGCHVDATVGIRVNERGGGEVRARIELDRDLVTTLRDVGKPVAEQPRVGDLTRAGWTVNPLQETKAGGAVLELSKRFANPAELRTVIDELSGPSGPFRDFRVTRRRHGLATRTALRGNVVLQGTQTGVAGDADLQQRLGAAGVDATDLQNALQAASEQAVTVRVAAQLPGTVDDNAPQHIGGQPVWVPKIGQRIRLVADATRTQWRRPVLAGAAVVLLLAAAVVMARPWRWRFRRPSGRPPSAELS